MLHLAQDFVEAATLYGRIIISEHFLPPEKKTIQPEALPGIIGGEKFVVHNILFKFAVDHKNIYGSDFSAAKAAGNELRGLMCYFNTTITDLHVPLMALVDYRGFRLTAMSLLPVDTSTIIYGTFDAGKTIHYTQDDTFNEKMRLASEVLRLRPHRCRQQPKILKQHAMTSAMGFGPTGHHASDSPQNVPPGFEGFSLYERERTPLLSQASRSTNGPHSKVRSHGATEELQLIMQGKLTKSSIDGNNELGTSGSSSLSGSTTNSTGSAFTGGTAAAGYDDATLFMSSSPHTGPSSPPVSSGSAINLNVSFNNQLIYSAVDLEGHKGLDGKYYLLDFSRVLPPESPNRKFQNPHLSRLLRPEFLKTYDKVLCSDAFSGFIQSTPDEEEINADVHEATRYLLETHIPKMARRIFEMMKEAKISKPLSKFRLTEALHSVGINCRYAGMLRKYISDEECSTFILAELVARAIKNNLRWRLREQHQILKLPLEEPYLRLVIDYLNLVFGNTAKSDEYWENFLKKDVAHNFEGTFSEEEEKPTWRLKMRLPDPTGSSSPTTISSATISTPSSSSAATEGKSTGNDPVTTSDTPRRSLQRSTSSNISETSSTSSSSPNSTNNNSANTSATDILTTSHETRVSFGSTRESDLSVSEGNIGSPSLRRQDSPGNPLPSAIRRDPSSSLTRDFRSSASPISPVHHHHSHRRMSKLSVDGSSVNSSRGSDSNNSETTLIEDSEEDVSSTSKWGRSFFSMFPYTSCPKKGGNADANETCGGKAQQNPAVLKPAPKLDHHFLNLVFHRVRAMMGLQFTHDRQYGWELESPFNDTDLKHVGNKVKHMNIISHVQGFFWQINGLMARSSNVAGLARGYYKAAIDKYEEALDLNPENKDVLRNLALTWMLLIDEDTKPSQGFNTDDWRLQKVREYILRAISAPPKYDSLSLFRYANLLSRCGSKEEAEDYYLQSLEADPNNTGCLHEYGEFLSEQGLDHEAEQFYRRSSETTAGAQRFPENFY